MAAEAACESHRNDSCTINTVIGNQKKSAPRIIPERMFQKQHFALRGGIKVRFPSLAFPSRPLKALLIGLSEELFHPSLNLSVNAADRSVPFFHNNKRGQDKGLILKSAIFTTFFFFIGVFFYLKSNLKCMDEVNHFFIVYLSLFYI